MIDRRRLSPEDLDAVGACLTAAVRGPFFPDWEFETLFGLNRSEVARVAEIWPGGEEMAEAEIAVVNSLVNLSGYPHGMNEELEAWVPGGLKTVLRLLESFRR